MQAKIRLSEKEEIMNNAFKISDRTLKIEKYFLENCEGIENCMTAKDIGLATGEKVSKVGTSLSGKGATIKKRLHKIGIEVRNRNTGKGGGFYYLRTNKSGKFFVFKELDNDMSRLLRRMINANIDFTMDFINTDWSKLTQPQKDELLKLALQNMSRQGGKK